MTDVETINRIAEVLGSSGAAATAEYARWYVASAIFWVLFGMALIVSGLLWKPSRDVLGPLPALLLKAFLIFAGALWVGCNIPDIANPKAIAIHQLIKDVRG